MTYPVPPYIEIKAHLRKSDTTNRLCELRIFVGEEDEPHEAEIDIGFKPEFIGIEWYGKAWRILCSHHRNPYDRQFRETEKSWGPSLYGCRYFGRRHLLNLCVWRNGDVDNGH